MLTLGRLYTLVFLLSVVSTVFGPALASAVPLIVERSKLTAANALIQSTTNLGMLLGPVAIPHVGVQNVLFLDAATFLVSTLCLVPIRMRTRGVPGTAASGRHVPGEILTGFKFVVVHQRTVRRQMLTSAFFSLGMSAFVFLLPVVANDLLRVGPIQLRWLWSALGAGTLVASAALSLVNQGDLRYRNV